MFVWGVALAGVLCCVVLYLSSIFCGKIAQEVYVFFAGSGQCWVAGCGACRGKKGLIGGVFAEYE